MVLIEYSLITSIQRYLAKPPINKAKDFVIYLHNIGFDITTSITAKNYQPSLMKKNKFAYTSKF